MYYIFYLKKCPLVIKDEEDIKDNSINLSVYFYFLVTFDWLKMLRKYILYCD